jgi:hypothetical protein
MWPDGCFLLRLEPSYKLKALIVHRRSREGNMCNAAANESQGKARSRDGKMIRSLRAVRRNDNAWTTGSSHCRHGVSCQASRSLPVAALIVRQLLQPARRTPRATIFKNDQELDLCDLWGYATVVFPSIHLQRKW